MNKQILCPSAGQGWILRYRMMDGIFIFLLFVCFYFCGAGNISMAIDNLLKKEYFAF